MYLKLLAFAYVLDVLALTVYVLHTGVLLFLCLSKRPRKFPEKTRGGCAGDVDGGEERTSRNAYTPKVTVQIPVYNERYVVERVIRAAASLDYPSDRLQIQILDDSNDETQAIARRAVEDARSKGVDIELIHRDHRKGYKAGALANGLRTAEGEFIAVFDADFLPLRNFLRRLICEHRVFEDPRIGFAQTRWSFLNRGERLLTQAQGLLLDKHFLVEQPARSRHGLLFNFNGSGGLWRRTCLEDAGGWQDDTLTEDLDLSYRAQFRGWRGIYLESETSPNELPNTGLAFKRQQRRWARGSAQCLRKLLPGLLRAPLTLGQKLAGVMQLSGYFCQLFLFVFILLWPQVVLHGMVSSESEVHVPVWLRWWGPLCVVVVASFLAAHWKRAGKLSQFLRDLPAALALAVGVSFSNSVAVVLGLVSRRSGEFERTPKGLTPSAAENLSDVPDSPPYDLSESNDGGQYGLLPDWTMWVELGMASYGLVTFALLYREGYVLMAFPMLFYAAAYAAMGLTQLNTLLSRSPLPILKLLSKKPATMRRPIGIGDP